MALPHRWPGCTDPVSRLYSQEEATKESALTLVDAIVLVLITALALGLRFYKLHHPNSVVSVDGFPLQALILVP